MFSIEKSNLNKKKLKNLKIKKLRNLKIVWRKKENFWDVKGG